MSSLFKRGSRYSLQYHDERRNPTRKQFSLRTNSKRTATKLKAELDDLYQRGLFDPWLDDFRERLEELKRPDKPEAAVHLSDAREAFLEAKSELSSSTRRMYELVTRLFMEHAGDVPMLKLSSSDVQSFLEAGDLSTTSKHTYKRHLKAFFRFCKEWGWVKTDATDGVSLKRKPEKTVKAFTRGEVDKLIEKAEGYLGPLIILATRTGLRRSELSRLQWQDVDLDGRSLLVRGQTKSGKERRVPLSMDALCALGALDHRHGYVFFLDKPWTPIHVDTITHDFLQLRRDVLPEKEDHSFHSLRHTFCTWLAEAGTPIHSIKRLAGHASIETTMQYVHAMHDGSEHIDEVFGS